MEFSKALSKQMDRRRVLSNVGLMGLGAFIASCTRPVLAQPRNADTEILNFALNLEYLEAVYYGAAVGRLDDARAFGGDAEIIFPEGFDPANGMDFGTDEFGQTVRELAEELAENEIAHVEYLRAELGNAAVSRPVIDLGPAFSAAASAATNGQITTFNPYSAPLLFLHGGLLFEDVGVTAYKGAAPLLMDPRLVEDAAGVLAVEAHHMGATRMLLYQNRDATVGGLTVAQIVQSISNARDQLGDPNEDKDQGIVGSLEGNPEYVLDGANIAPSDPRAIAFSRTPREVLNIVYLERGATSGGFYPNGFNGDFSALL
jgi:hypothetical protein